MSVLFGAEDNLNDIAVSINQFLRGIHRRYFSIVHDGDTVTQIFRFVHKMRHQNDSRAAVTDCLDKVPGDMTGGRVKTGGHLIEEYYLGIVHQCQGD